MIERSIFEIVDSTLDYFNSKSFKPDQDTIKEHIVIAACLAYGSEKAKAQLKKIGLNLTPNMIKKAAQAAAEVNKYLGVSTPKIDTTDVYKAYLGLLGRVLKHALNKDQLDAFRRMVYLYFAPDAEELLRLSTIGVSESAEENANKQFEQILREAFVETSQEMSGQD